MVDPPRGSAPRSLPLTVEQPPALVVLAYQPSAEHAVNDDYSVRVFRFYRVRLQAIVGCTKHSLGKIDMILSLSSGM